MDLRSFSRWAMAAALCCLAALSAQAQTPTAGAVAAARELLAIKGGTVSPGDVVATGTPAGVGPLTEGDVVEVVISGIGTLRNPVINRRG